MRKVVLGFILLSLALCQLPLRAQRLGVVRGNCMPGLTATEGVAAARRQIAHKTSWDATKTYKQLVILVEPSDTTFEGTDPQARYNRIFNEEGYNEGKGAGCVADYFRCQSGGLFNVSFDVFGPYKVSAKAKPNANATEDTQYYGADAMREATRMMKEANPDWDYKQYDWDGNSYVDQTIYIFAGPAGNTDDPSFYGYLWPNSSSFGSVEMGGGIRISSYTCSAEIWSKNLSCGIGTICHEYSHSLGLPDIYDTVGGSIVADEWDLMDGGNFTNAGWCPPNYTAQEKMCLGWLTPVELTGPATITGMKPVSEGGEVYLVRHTDSEYYLLENRQWTKWDAGLPGRGLLVSHVDYDASKWNNNRVNTESNHLRFDLVHADNMNFSAWYKKLPNGAYAGSSWMHNRWLSTSAYPYTSDDATTVNRDLTDTTTPASTMYQENASGQKLLSKSITNVTVSADGLVSFDFMGGAPSAIRTLRLTSGTSYLTDLQGRRVERPSKGIYLRNGKKFIVK